MSSNPPINSYAAVWGPSLTATFLAAVIYGVTVLQSFFYYNHYQSDRISWKVLVAVIFILDTAALGLYIYSLQYYLVLSWGLPQNLAIDIIGFPIEFILTTILTFLVQSFYINTIRALRAPLAVTLFLFVLSLTALVSGFILPAVQIRLRLIPAIVMSPLNHIAFNIARGAALACDLGIVVTLCALLRRKKTGVHRANNMINTLIVFAVQRGVLQALIQAGEVISYAVKPDGIFFLPFHVIVSRIYCTSLLATLNARSYVARRGLPAGHASTSPPGDSDGASRTGPLFTSYFDPPFLPGSASSGSEPPASTPGGPPGECVQMPGWADACEAEDKAESAGSLQLSLELTAELKRDV